MKIENVDEAAKAAADYRKLLAEIEHFHSMKWFRVSGGSDSAVPLPLTEAVCLQQSGSHGLLADKIRAAMIEYYAIHKRLAEERLTRLGVVLR